MTGIFPKTLVMAMAVFASGCATKGRPGVRHRRQREGRIAEPVARGHPGAEQQNAARIEQVDQKAGQAGEAAKTAQKSAATARTAAEAAAAKVTAVESASRRLIFEVVITDTQGNFQPGNADLTDDARAKLDTLAAKLKESPAGNFIEIEGHTDSSGSLELNEGLGLARAESAKRYLYETYQIPLHKINVISYGESKPVAPNNTRDGRAQNRRVVVKVLG